MDFKEKQCLIAYFSRKGENYAGGSIVNLAVGNTETAAWLIAAETGGSLLEIRTRADYPLEYEACTRTAQAEKRGNVRPELTAAVHNLAGFDVIFLGYPNWWGTCPMAVFTFLESNDFSGKTILPFCTHEGSGMGASERDIQQAVPGASVRRGLPILGSAVQGAQGEISRWLKGL